MRLWALGARHAARLIKCIERALQVVRLAINLTVSSAHLKGFLASLKDVGPKADAFARLSEKNVYLRQRQDLTALACLPAVPSPTHTLPPTQLKGDAFTDSIVLQPGALRRLRKHGVALHGGALLRARRRSAGTFARCQENAKTTAKASYCHSTLA